MEQKCIVWVSVRDSSSGSPSHDTELGEFHAVWKEGVSIGSDPGCTVVLPGLAAVAGRIVAKSNHKVLYRLPAGTALPLPPLTHALGPYDQRVDDQAFALGPYMISFWYGYHEESRSEKWFKRLIGWASKPAR